MKKIIITIISSIFFLTATTIFIVGFGTVEVKNNQQKPIDLKNINKDIYVKVYRSKKDVVEKILIEEYVAGVVSAEMPAEFPIEALKAQAITARTYVIAHMEEFGGKSNPSAKGGNVTDTIENQVYYEREERVKSWQSKKAEEYWNKIIRAVKETELQIITYQGALVMNPYYFSTSGGKTENSVDVFNFDEPYLKSVKSPGEEESRKFKGEFKIVSKEFANKINGSYSGSIKSDISIINQILIIKRATGGGVIEIKIGKTTMSGVNFRQLFNLNSSNFTIKNQGDLIVISTMGYGHGVGMSQWGAKAMADKNSSYIDIIKHYYSGVSIERIDLGNKQMVKLS